MRLIVGLLCWLSVGAISQAQAYNIEVNIENYEASTLMLGYHFGVNQFIQDTITKAEDGMFHIEGDEPLIPGIYLLVLSPNNAYVEFLVEPEDQDMTLSMDAQKVVKTFKAEDSKANTEFYDYLNFLDVYQSQIRNLRTQIEQDTTDAAAKKKAEDKVASLKEEVKEGQQKWLVGNPDGFVAALINANSPLVLPEFVGSDEEKNLQQWKYYRAHYFDNASLSDARLLRTPILLPRVDYYLDKLTVQHPDSIIKTIDLLIDQMSPNEIVFKFGVSHVLNKYATSKIVGMDAVYVHLIENYYAKGKTPWVAEANIAKMAKQAAKVKPLLIGKTAPDIHVFAKDGSDVRLHDIDSPFTVLLFWAPDCSHCKKTMPSIVDFYNGYKDKGVEILAVCTKSRDKEPACWELVAEKGMDIWVNASDKELKSRFQLTYDIRSTPQIYILDAEKKIVMKQIGSEQLPVIMDQILKTHSQVK